MRFASRRTLLAAVGLVLLSSVPSPRASASRQDVTPDPVAIADAIYAKVSAGDGDSGGQFLWVDPKVRPRRFSKALCELWLLADARRDANHEGLGAIGFDPFTASQDPVVKSFTLRSERQDGKAATVAVTLVDPRGRREIASDETVRLDFVRENGLWVIDDIRGTVGGRAWSVRESLRRYLEP